MANDLKIRLDFRPVPDWDASGSESSLGLDDAGDGAASIFVAPKADTITHIGLEVSNIIGTSASYLFAIEGVDGSGLPDGTPIASVVIAPSSIGFQWFALDTPVALTMGQVIAITITYSSGTIDTSNRIFAVYARVCFANPGLPYAYLMVAGSWSNRITNAGPAFAYKSATRVYGHPAVASAVANNLITSGHRGANRFVLPASLGQSVTVNGVHFRYSPAVAAGGSFSLGIWDADGNELGSSLTVYDPDHAVQPGAADNGVYYFDSTVELSTNTPYFIGFQHTGTNITQRTFNVSDNADLNAYPGGVDCYYNQWDGSAWVATNNAFIPMALLVCDWNAGSGGGGGNPLYGSRMKVVQ